MLRLCDKGVYRFEIEAAERNRILSFILSKKLYDIIIMFYNKRGNYIGIATYKSILMNQLLDDAICKETMLIDKNFFEKANNFFDNNKNFEYLPVTNNKNEIIYFCYSSKVGLNHYLIEQIKALKRYHDSKFIPDVYPDIKVVHIYGFNEASFYLYEILEKRKFPYVLHGKIWDFLREDNHSTNEEFPSYSILNIYSEGIHILTSQEETGINNNQNLTGYFPLIDSIFWFNYYSDIKYIMKSISNAINVIQIKIPGSDVTKYYPYDDKWREYPRKDLAETLESAIEKEGVFDTFGKDSCKNCREGKTKEHRFYKQFANVKMFSVIDEERKNYIYAIGSCITEQAMLMTEDTIWYQLQKKLDDIFPNMYKVMCISIQGHNFDSTKEVFKSLDIKTNDIILFLYTTDKSIKPFSEEKDLDLTELFIKKPKNEVWFADIPAHLNQVGCRIVFDYIWNNRIQKTILGMNWSSEQHYLQLGRDDTILQEKSFLNYLDFLKKEKIQNVSTAAAIVMNCNPFTLGHQYLIEKAACEVNFLYVFVVEENKSFFSFEDRFNLVKHGTSHLSNVKVLPSGRFIISATTFAAYFIKEENNNIIINANEDLKIFANFIAPTLNINCRYVGEEPIDRITKQYNEQMKEILCEYGIKVDEIKRKEINGQIISASRVRKLLEKQDFTAIKELVPSSTYEFLVKNYSTFSPA